MATRPRTLTRTRILFLLAFNNNANNAKLLLNDVTEADAVSIVRRRSTIPLDTPMTTINRRENWTNPPTISTVLNKTRACRTTIPRNRRISQVGSLFAPDTFEHVCSDVPSTSGNASLSPNLSTSTESPNSLRGLELIRSVPQAPAPLPPPSPHTLLDDLLSIFDNASFSSDELELLISKIATKHILNKQDIHRMLSNAKSEMSLERILDETYLSQVKILAIELKSEKNRVLELAKSNAEMDHTIRQLQQQQQTIPSIPQYQQMIMQHQMQLRRMADENARLQHQLHSYAMLPASINELRQQHQILGEQFRQLSLRNGALENEAAESERASKHAAEIYKKGRFCSSAFILILSLLADAQKQERIEQMIADINKYKKLDKELTSLRQKHQELEKSVNSQVSSLTEQRDDLQAQCDKYKEHLHDYDEVLRNVASKSKDQLERELNEFKAKNDQIRQQNWKVMDDINRLSGEKN